MSKPTERHNHDWILVDKTIMKPITSSGLTLKGGTQETVKLYQRMMQGYIVMVFKCASPDCGEVKTEEH